MKNIFEMDLGEARHLGGGPFASKRITGFEELFERMVEDFVEV